MVSKDDDKHLEKLKTLMNDISKDNLMKISIFIENENLIKLKSNDKRISDYITNLAKNNNINAQYFLGFILCIRISLYS